MNASDSPVARRLMVLSCATLLVAALLAGTAGAAQFNVTNTNDSGAGSLRQAIADATANPGDDDVVIQPGLGTITLQSEILWFSSGSLAIIGNGATINAGGAARALVSDGGGDLSVDGITITGVGGSIDDNAAPIVTEGNGVSVSNCTITGNIVNSGDGDAAGAVLSEGGPVAIQGCDITANTATTTSGDAAGGVLSEGGDVVVGGSSIICNSASSDSDSAGGLLSEGGAVSITDSTIQGNTATGATSENQVFSNGPDPVITNTVISDDDSICATSPTTPTTPTTPKSPPGTSPTDAAPAAQPVATTPSFTG
ncbi:MAG: hypothetical protein M5U31_13750 [Acidimicrobiia bacterium]|nr:hypothetical protein [Acidimicrobiia bacterium]